MRAAVRLVAASLAAVFAAQVYALVTVADDEQAPDRAQPVVPTFRLAYTDPADAVEEAGDHDLFVLNADAADHARRIKDANPDATILVYKDLSFAADWDPDGISHGVGWAEATARPDWFAVDAAGARIESSGFPGNFLLRVDDATYQQAWLANVRATLADPVWDGVFVDDTNWKADFAGVAPAGHDDDTWRAATTSFLAAVTPGLRERGLVILNIGAGYAAPGIWREWLPYADGAMEEHLGRFGFEDQLRNLRDAARLGKLVLSGIGDERALAALVLTTEPGRRLAPAAGGAEWDLGDAVGPGRETEPGVFTRSFTGGVVELDTHTGAVSVTTVRDGTATPRG